MPSGRLGLSSPPMIDFCLLRHIRGHHRRKHYRILPLHVSDRCRRRCLQVMPCGPKGFPPATPTFGPSAGCMPKLEFRVSTLISGKRDIAVVRSSATPLRVRNLQDVGYRLPCDADPELPTQPPDVRLLDPPEFAPPAQSALSFAVTCGWSRAAGTGIRHIPKARFVKRVRAT